MMTGDRPAHRPGRPGSCHPARTPPTRCPDQRPAGSRPSRRSSCPRASHRRGRRCRHGPWPAACRRARTRRPPPRGPSLGAADSGCGGRRIPAPPAAAVPADAMMVAEPALLRILGRGHVEGPQAQLAIVRLDLDRAFDRPARRCHKHGSSPGRAAGGIRARPSWSWRTAARGRLVPPPSST